MNHLFDQSLLLSVFGAPKIEWKDLVSLHSQTPGLIYWVAPIVVISALIELYVIKHDQHRKKEYDPAEARASFLIGVGFLISNYITRFIQLAWVVWVYNVIPWRMEMNWWLLIPCLLLTDFCAYWCHVVMHHSRFWWSMHIPHHSANHYNLTVNFRLSWVEQLRELFFLPVLLAGFHPILFFVANQLAAIFQIGYHTEYVGRFHRWIEYVFVTPSHHKVHHASNKKYLDKNFGNVLILWDRWFGTFQAEEEKPVYGLVTPDHSNNVFHIVFHEFVNIARDVRNARGGLREIMNLIFGSPSKIAAAKKQKLNESKTIKS